jgi:hypothetical protein
VAVRSKVWVCGHSLAGIVGLNPKGGGGGDGYLSREIVVCDKVEAAVIGRSLVQRSPAKCGVSECELETLTRRRPRRTGAVEP